MASAVLAAQFAPGAAIGLEVQGASVVGVAVASLMWARTALRSAGDVVYDIAKIGVDVVSAAGLAVTRVMEAASVELSGLISSAAAVSKAMLQLAALAAVVQFALQLREWYWRPASAASGLRIGEAGHPGPSSAAPPPRGRWARREQLALEEKAAVRVQAAFEKSPCAAASRQASESNAAAGEATDLRMKPEDFAGLRNAKRGQMLEQSALFDSVKIAHVGPHIYMAEVPSESQAGLKYRVKVEWVSAQVALELPDPCLPDLWCSCPDHRHRGAGCRHACAVLWRLLAQTAAAGAAASEKQAPSEQAEPQDTPPSGAVTPQRYSISSPTGSPLVDRSPVGSPQRTGVDVPARASQLYRESVEAVRRQRELEKQVRKLEQQLVESEQRAAAAAVQEAAAGSLGWVCRLMDAAETRASWVRIIGEALENQPVQVMAFTLDLEDVVDALCAARRRGCVFQMIVDKRQSTGTSTKHMRVRVQQLVQAGVAVRARTGGHWQGGPQFTRGMMHAKLVRAGPKLVVGSTNHTSSSQQCCEAALEVTLSPAGLEVVRSRFELDFSGACP